MSQSKTLLLTSADIARLVSHVGPDRFMSILIDRLSDAFAHSKTTKLEIPARDGFHYPQGLVEWMPLYQHENAVLMKMVGYHPANPHKRRLPTVVCSLSLFDTNTGQLTALADGALLTAMRTGAASAIATRMLSPATGHDLGLIGCGAQAVTQLHALSQIRTFKTVRIFDTSDSVLRSFPQRCESFVNSSTAIQRSSLKDLVEQSDVICTATSVGVGRGPVFDAVNIRPHLHINAVGADLPGKTELPLDLLRNAFVVPDFIAQATSEGECQQLAAEDIGPSITELATTPEAFVNRKHCLTVFDSTGWALEDFVAIQLAIELAADCRIGSRVAIESMKSDPWNPYEELNPTRSSTELPPLPDSEMAVPGGDEMERLVVK